MCELVERVEAELLCETNTATRHVSFPTDGFVSSVVLIEGIHGVEAGMVERGGMPAAEMALGVSTAPLHALVQGSGAVLRVSATAFRRELCHQHVEVAVLAAFSSCLLVFFNRPASAVCAAVASPLR